MRNILYELNLDALVKTIILLGFALFFFLIIQSGQVLTYVHPRIVPYMYFAIIVIILMVLFSLPDLRRRQKNVTYLPYLIFLLPLLTAFALPPQAMDTSPISFGSANAGAEGSAGSRSDDSISSSGSNIGDSNVADDSQSDQYSYSGREPELQMIDGSIVLDDDNFYQWSEEIFTNMDAYAGKQIEATGFIMQNEQLIKNDFALARLLMTCCVADTVPIGFLCRYEESENLEDHSWIKVTGNIKVMDYNGQTLPVIVIDKLEPTSKPDNEYVYPY